MGISLWIWCFDGFDLCYWEDGKGYMTGLEFEDIEDARYALRCFDRLLNG